MAGKSNTEQIQEIAAELRQLTGRFEVHVALTVREFEVHAEKFAGATSGVDRALAELRASCERLTAIEHRCTQMERFNPERVAFLEQRCSHLEKLVDEGRTRRWQVWLAFLGAALSATVALVVAFTRRP